MSEALFDLEPTLVEVGDVVQAQTIYGAETGTVTEKGVDDAGFPLVTLALESGDTITVGVARLGPAGA